ncbi:Zn-ribbon domain-containing OB-fold protein [Mycobacterium sp.]|uniref:Zn-ribbon domain-containing OB-fold protein n=1 Tax=Mycobacterium sp. TaxID=1785 RepID=UPI003BAEEDA4
MTASGRVEVAAVDQPYWDALRANEVRLPQCARCASWIWPAGWRCGECGSYEMEWKRIDAYGTVYSWCRTHYAFSTAYADLVPYVNVLVELPAAGHRRVLGLMIGDQDGLKIGAAVSPVIEQASARTRGLPALRWQLVWSEASSRLDRAKFADSREGHESSMEGRSGT